MHVFVPTQNLPLNLASHMTRGRSTSREKSLLNPNIRSRALHLALLSGRPVFGLSLLLGGSQTFLQQFPGQQDCKEVDDMRGKESAVGQEESRVKVRLVKKRDCHL